MKTAKLVFELRVLWAEVFGYLGCLPKHAQILPLFFLFLFSLNFFSLFFAYCANLAPHFHFRHLSCTDEEAPPRRHRGQNGNAIGQLTRVKTGLWLTPFNDRHHDRTNSSRGSPSTTKKTKQKQKTKKKMQKKKRVLYWESSMSCSPRLCTCIFT